MKAISLWQPHAFAVAMGLKAYETRGWATDYRGPVAIHAAKRSWSDVGPWHSEARQKLDDYVSRRGPQLWVFGAVICTAEITSCMRTSELRGRIPGDHEFWGDFSDGEDGSGRYAFKLDNVQALAEPVYCRGMQGWFAVELGADERVAPAMPSQQMGLFDGLAVQTTPAPAVTSVEIPQPGSLAACEIARRFAQACEDAGFMFRGHGFEGGDYVYDFSAPGAPDRISSIPLRAWDGSAEALRAASW